MTSASPFAVLSRRRVLKLAAAGAGVLLVGAGSIAALRGSAPAVSGLRVLDAHAYRTLTALAHVHIPKGGPFEVGAEDLGVDLALAFDAYLADLPPADISDLKTALVLLELGPVLFEGKLTTFPNLSPEERAAHFRSWSESRTTLRRQIAFAFRKFLAFVFYDQPRVWPHIGYGGPLFRPVSP